MSASMASRAGPLGAVNAAGAHRCQRNDAPPSEACAYGATGSGRHAPQHVVALDEMVIERGQRMQADHEVERVADQLVRFLDPSVLSALSGPNSVNDTPSQSSDTGLPPRFTIMIPSSGCAMMNT